mmetsp:Transcript_6129/g.14768  ORF Transcript_6129/g.14768 Transcript_6129/m.14768 type:complete len:360 (+) Transcript_6129:309-1388(+)|eukprot:CAMPEP_0114518044 /NCGR_PEP_ID=MMETSP0109-20121206/18230_1 /TAXON_ID=29199 /ORGANISM="Chlorarachnion reptans, Strain CCCM449" /LENGTH=359 /DNA_ID=CAMNT_0001698631 /DNA_START=383 /DNA_END=1462 /DNA_ORIENTATION=-
MSTITPVPCPLLKREKVSEKTELMTRSELLNLMSGRDLILLDTRSANEMKEGKLMQSINVPVTDEFLSTVSTPQSMIKTIRGAGRFKLNARTRSNKKTVIVSRDGKTGEKDPAGAVAKILNDAAVLCVLEGGFEAFNSKFPFAVNKMTLPWFPTVLIEDFLYLGSEDDAKQQEHLRRLGITHILNVSSDVKNYFPQQYTYHRINLPDEPGSNLSEHFQMAFKFLKTSDLDTSKRVLVHCHQGVSRSSTIVLAYFMHSKHWTLKDAYEFTKANRPQIRPNPGFWRQLEAFEKSLFGVSTLDQCVDIEAEEREYKAKNDPEEIGEMDDDEDENSTSRINKSTGQSEDPGIANDKCELCAII